jgi:hypothetical protein
MPSMFDIVKSCHDKKLCAPVNYSKLETGGNNPNFTMATIYTNYVRRAHPKKVFVSGDANTGLAAKGITFHSEFSTILVSLQFTNLKQFNMPRLKVFSRTNVR